MVAKTGVCDAVAAAEDLGGAGGGDAFGGLVQFGQDVLHGFACGQAQADAVVAGQARGGRRHQVADAGQAEKRQRLAAGGDAELGHLHQAARHQGGFGVVAEAQAVGDAARRWRARSSARRPVPRP